MLKIRRYICILLTVAVAMMFTTVIGITVSAQTSGDGWSFDETTGALTITTNNGTTAWKKSVTDKKLVQSVVIQEGVASIGSSAFNGCTALKSIEIPDSVMSIGSQAFTSCYKLEGIKIPNGVTSIGLMTFWDCLDLASIEIPDSVTSIGNFAFVGCRSLESIKIPNGVESINWSAFVDCKGLTSIDIPDSVTSIGGCAFQGCSGLTSIIIPNNVTSIGSSAFEGCSGLTSIIIPNNVASIGEEALKDCSSLASIVIPDSVTSVDSDVFMGCSSLDNIIYPSGLDVSGASIPDTSAQVEYTVNNGEVTITEIILPDGKAPVVIPDTIGGKNVTGTAEGIRNKVSESGHTHRFSAATCTQKETCAVCGMDQGELAEHTPDSGTVTKQPTTSETGERTYKCTVCGNVIRTETIDKLPSGGGGSETPTEPTDPTEPSDPTDPTTPDEPISPSRPDNEVPFIKDENGKNGWEVINDEIDKAEDGSTVTVDMNGATVVPGNVFDTLRGKDVTVVFDMGDGITWSVNGKDVTFGNTSDIDLSVKSDTENIPVDVINNITGERYSIQISLAHNGEFGFTAVLSINLGSGNAGQKAALYYYDGGILELMCESEISADGTARLTFTHASDYLIVIGESETDEGDNSDTTSGGVGNPSEADNSGTTSGGGVSEPGKKDPDEQDGNPSTGVATSLIPLAIAAAFIVAAAKRKMK